MDIRYERLQYFRRLSRKLGDGMLYHDPWHRLGCLKQPREDKYKNIDRTTIRRPGGRRIAYLAMFPVKHFAAAVPLR
jgi:hypothetical protein